MTTSSPILLFYYSMHFFADPNELTLFFKLIFLYYFYHHYVAVCHSRLTTLTAFLTAFTAGPNRVTSAGTIAFIFRERNHKISLECHLYYGKLM